MPGPYTNLHGRKPTRGLRPWILMPKVLAVGLYFGGLVATLLLWLTPSQDAPPSRSAAALLFTRLCLPAMTAGVILGVLLFLQHPLVFARQRWWQVKMAILLLCMPISDWVVLTGMAAPPTAGSSGASAGSVTAGLATLIVASVLLIVLGRQKPRLGQNWAKAFPHARPSEPPRP